MNSAGGLCTAWFKEELQRWAATIFSAVLLREHWAHGLDTDSKHGKVSEILALERMPWDDSPEDLALLLPAGISGKAWGKA